MVKLRGSIAHLNVAIEQKRNSSTFPAALLRKISSTHAFIIKMFAFDSSFVGARGMIP